MRTIKFRAWDKERRCMVKVNALQFKANLVLGECLEYHVDIGDVNQFAKPMKKFYSYF